MVFKLSFNLTRQNAFVHLKEGRAFVTVESDYEFFARIFALDIQTGNELDNKEKDEGTHFHFRLV